MTHSNGGWKLRLAVLAIATSLLIGCAAVGPEGSLGFSGSSHLECAVLGHAPLKDPGKIELWHLTLKNRILLEHHYLPGAQEEQVSPFGLLPLHCPGSCLGSGRNWLAA